MEIKTKIMDETIDAMSSEFDYDFGWRFSEEKFEIGDELPNSYEWEGDEQTDIELSGTSIFDSISDLLEYAKYSTGYVFLVFGTNNGSGQEPGESIMSEATVLQSWSWKKGFKS